MLGAVHAHLEQRGWADKAYLYTYDEPLPPNRERVGPEQRTLARLAPGLRRLVTLPPREDLLGAVDRWTPVLTHVVESEVAAAQGRGEQVWTYVCCCMEWPSPTLMLDHPPMQARLLPLVVDRLGLDGFLYWSVAHWQGADGLPADPWSDPLVRLPDGEVAGNGDGRLFYPPRDGNDTDVVVSIRWELLREGFEDADRVALLRELLALRAEQGQDVEAWRGAARVPATVVEGRSWWTEDPADLEAWRLQVLDGIEALMALGPQGLAELDQVGLRPEPEPLAALQPVRRPLHRRSERDALTDEQARSRAEEQVEYAAWVEERQERLATGQAAFEALARRQSEAPEPVEDADAGERAEGPEPAAPEVRAPAHRCPFAPRVRRRGTRRRTSVRR
jgi:hypothetical protein